jgi:hypothetical protein
VPKSLLFVSWREGRLGREGGPGDNEEAYCLAGDVIPLESASICPFCGLEGHVLRDGLVIDGLVIVDVSRCGEQGRVDPIEEERVQYIEDQIHLERQNCKSQNWAKNCCDRFLVVNILLTGSVSPDGSVGAGVAANLRIV